jgi:hypothetical protein
MKMLRIIGRVVLGLFMIWGLIALFHTVAREPNQRPFLFWLVLPYPVLIWLTWFVLSACARNEKPQGIAFSWFAVGVGAAAGVGLALAVCTALFSIISWAYFGRVSLSSSGSTDANYLAINVFAYAACYVWAGAISASLSAQRPLHHALAAGLVLVLWSCAVTLVVQPLVLPQLLAALLLPIPLAALGARLLQARMRTGHG